ncbi:MAG: tRNA (cytosine40 48-C5)-methyltransferase [Archaeoglobi archaeon]|nr:tRNA (cytosine40 48-C5)-methyltransferase [Archaeoglobi archaeon]
MDSQIIDFPSDERSRKLAKKYGYDEFIVRRFLNLFPDAERMIEVMEEIPPKYIRVNTLRISEKELLERLEKRGFVLRKTDIRWCYQVESEPFSISATPEHLLGYFYIQDASSCIPPLALSPSPHDLVLDACASPGGKTTMLAQIMGNRGKIVALELKEERMLPLIYNLNRCGVENTLCFHMNALEVSSLNLEFDGILLDAPCTGEGVISKDPTRKSSRRAEDIISCSVLQRELMDSCVSVLKPGGVLVYSTCSFAPEENELVVQYAIEKHGMRLEEIPYGEPALVEAGKMKFSEEMRKARRFYPHIHGTQGFFVARMVKP